MEEGGWGVVGGEMGAFDKVQCDLKPSQRCFAYDATNSNLTHKNSDGEDDVDDGDDENGDDDVDDDHDDDDKISSIMLSVLTMLGFSQCDS